MPPEFDKYGEIISDTPDPASGTASSQQASRRILDEIAPTPYPRNPTPRRQSAHNRSFVGIVLGGMVALCIVITIVGGFWRLSLLWTTGVPGSQASYPTPVGVVAGGIQDTSNEDRLATATEIAVKNLPDMQIASGLGQIQIQDVNLRAEPGSEKQIITILRRGTLITILKRSQIAENNIWVYVRVGDIEGWINYRYVLPIDEQYLSQNRARVINVAPLSLRVRSTPAENASIVDRLSEGAEVEVINRDVADGVEWCYIREDQIQGWVKAEYLEAIR